MSRYIRFQTSVLCARARRPLGIFRATGVLQTEGRIEAHFTNLVEKSLDWFSSNLTSPPINETEKNCVFWFCANQAQMVAEIWDLVSVLEMHDVNVTQVRTDDPGMIVYRDEFQVAALPSQWINRALRRGQNYVHNRARKSRSVFSIPITIQVAAK